MPEHSETTPTHYMSELTRHFMQMLSGESGRLIAAASVAKHPLRSDTWIVTMTTEQGIHEVWHVPATKDATP